MSKRLLRIVGIVLITVSLFVFGFIYFYEKSFAEGKEKQIQEAKMIINSRSDKNTDLIKEDTNNVVPYQDYLVFNKDDFVVSNDNNKENVEKEKKEKDIRNFNVEEGDIFGLIRIPELDIESALLEGVDLDYLKHGVGKYTQTGFSGQGKQIFLAGHNNTSFKDVDTLENGAEIFIDMEYGTYKYRMVKSEIVHQSRTDKVGEDVDKETLVLMTCYPYWDVNTDERLLIYAEIVE